MSIDLILQLHRATHRVGLFLEGWAPPLELGQAEAHILVFLAQRGACPIGEVHRAFAHRKSTLTGVLDRLAARGWVLREANPADRRSTLVRLTEPGESQAARAAEALGTLGADLARALPTEDLEAALRCLRVLEEAAEARSTAR